jgi:hypothetical protein
VTLGRVIQPTINIVKDENGDLFVDSHSILDRWRIHFSQLLNVHGVNDVRKKEIRTAEPLVPQPSVFEAEMTIDKLKNQDGTQFYHDSAWKRSSETCMKLTSADCTVEYS